MTGEGERSKLEQLADPTVDVVIACHDAGRLPLIERALQSVLKQAGANVGGVFVAVDHNRALADRVEQVWRRDITVVRSERPKGASGTRNAGAMAGSSDLIAFLDDDAQAREGWLAELVSTVSTEGTIGAGGLVEPSWQGPAPWWFPPEFRWVVGATIETPGVIRARGPVRNVWAESMIVRRPHFEAIDGFDETFGKVGTASQPEDTDLCLRTVEASPGGQWLFTPRAVVDHYVPSERSSIAFFLWRCFNEGRSKALMATKLGMKSRELSSERQFVASTLGQSTLNYMRMALTRRQFRPVVQLACMIAGLVAAVSGYAIEWALRLRVRAAERG